MKEVKQNQSLKFNNYNSQEENSQIFIANSRGLNLKRTETINNTSNRASSGFELILQSSLNLTENDNQTQMQISIDELRGSGVGMGASGRGFNLNVRASKGVREEDDDLLSQENFEEGRVIIKTISNKHYTYHGETKLNEREGFGICNFTNGNKYIGHWKNNKQNGLGKLTKINNQGKTLIYEGEFKNSKPDGYVRVITTEGFVIQGQIKNYCFEKHCPVIINSSNQFSEMILLKEINTLTYNGELCSGSMADKNECSYSRQAKEESWNQLCHKSYRESIVENKNEDEEFNYYSHRASTDSSTLSSNILTSEAEVSLSLNEKEDYHETCSCILGLGRMINRDRSSYEGYIINNFQDREGIFKKESMIYKGRKNERKYNGFCEITYKDGTKYFGHFNKNKKNGLGCFISNDKLLNLAFYTENQKNGGSITRKYDYTLKKEILIYENYHHGFRSSKLEAKNTIADYVVEYYPEQKRLLEIDYNHLINLLEA